MGASFPVLAIDPSITPSMTFSANYKRSFPEPATSTRTGFELFDALAEFREFLQRGLQLLLEFRQPGLR
jgi:hypothetical protein